MTSGRYASLSPFHAAGSGSGGKRRNKYLHEHEQGSERVDDIMEESV